MQELGYSYILFYCKI